MNQEFKKEWIDALRSGKYEQGKNQLVDNGKYCCLGVACDLLADKGIVYQKDECFYGNTSRHDYSMYELPASASRYMEVSGSDPMFEMDKENMKQSLPKHIKEGTGSYEWVTLALLNDSDYSFDEIADIIEKEL